MQRIARESLHSLRAFTSGGVNGGGGGATASPTASGGGGDSGFIDGGLRFEIGDAVEVLESALQHGEYGGADGNGRMDQRKRMVAQAATAASNTNVTANLFAQGDALSRTQSAAAVAVAAAKARMVSGTLGVASAAADADIDGATADSDAGPSGGGGAETGVEDIQQKEGSVKDGSDASGAVGSSSGRWLDALVVGVVVQSVSVVYSADRNSAGGLGEAGEATVHECTADSVTPLGGEQDRHGREQGLVVGAEVLVHNNRVAVITAMHMHYLVRYMKEKPQLKDQRAARAANTRAEAHAKVAPQVMREVLGKGQTVLMSKGPGQASSGAVQGQGQYILVRVVTVRVTCLLRHEADVDDDDDGDNDETHSIIRHRQGTEGTAVGMDKGSNGAESEREWMQLSDDTCFGMSVALRNLSRVQGGRAKLVRSGCVQAVVLLFSHSESKMELALAAAAAAAESESSDGEARRKNDGVHTDAEKAAAEQQQRRRLWQYREKEEEARRLRQKVVTNCHEASVNMALDGAESSSSRFVHKGGGVLLVRLLGMAASALVAQRQGTTVHQVQAEQDADASASGGAATDGGQLQGEEWALSFLSSVTKAAAQVAKPEGTRPRLASEGIVPPLVAILGAYEHARTPPTAKGATTSTGGTGQLGTGIDLGVIEQAALALCRMALPDAEYHLRAASTPKALSYDNSTVHDVRRALLRAKRLFGHRVPLELIRPLQEALAAIDPGVSIAPA
jgi:hypothetical protein